jgi:hypothetical protein
MRVNSLVLATLAAITAGGFAAPAGALTQTSGAAMRVAADGIDTVADVHCRPYRHPHPGGYYGRGCGRSEIEIRHRRGVVEERDGVRARVGIHSRSSTTRSETSVRSRENASTRSETNVRSRESGTTSRTRTGTSSGGGGQGSMKSGGGSSAGQNSGGGSNSTGNSPGGGQQTR